MTRNTFFFSLLASLTISSSGLQAQYRWHIVQPDHVGSNYYGFTGISCFGESCSAVGQVWRNLLTPDSNFILHSTDGGLTWNSIDSAIPHLRYFSNGVSGIIFYAIDQIDSLDAVAVGNANIALISTFDGWKTWHTDTGFAPVVQAGDTTQFLFQYLDFANVAEGEVFDTWFNDILTTVDSGNHWAERKIGGHAYGNRMFRSFLHHSEDRLDTILTTYDNWNNIDTALITLNGPFLDTAVHFNSIIYGTGDTLVITGFRWDKNDVFQSVMMARSPDLGANWTELPLPRNTEIFPPTVSAIDAQTIIVTGYHDSLGRIILSTDRGDTWNLDTLSLDNGVPYYEITSVAVSGSGRVIASILTDSNYLGSRVLAYMEAVPSSVTPTVSNKNSLRLYPNPATNTLYIENLSGVIKILDPLGRSYDVRQRENSLDISTLPPGVYFLTDGLSRAKFIRE